MKDLIIKENPLGVKPIGKLLAQFAIPSCFALVINALYNIVDQIFIGQSVGYLGNGATNITLPYTILALGICMLFGNGCAAFYSQMLGRKNKEAAKNSVITSIIVSTVLTIIIMIVFLLFAEPLCRLTGATDELMPYALDYGLIVVIGFPTVGFAGSFANIIRADGSPGFSMFGLVAGCATNVILDYIFIFPLGMGVKGAAIATVIGQFVNVVIFIFYFPKFKNVKFSLKDIKMDFQILGRVVKLGLSSFITQVSVVIIIIVTNRVMVRYGAMSEYGAEIPLTALGVTMKINNILIALMNGIGVGALPIIGFNYGAGNYDRMKEAVKKAIFASTVCGIIATICFQVFPYQLISMFGAENDLYLDFGVKCLRIFLIFCILDGLNYSVPTCMQAMEKSKFSIISALCRQLIFNIPVLYICAAAFGIFGTLLNGPIAAVSTFILDIFLIVIALKKVKVEIENRKNE